ncbi:MAG: thioredoxin TrxC [Deltaproteobacteria bacterium]|nr:thioredoxin TrxC [Deltaproteobacteria bacterium]MBN2672737.1 thioredoxin TrxC [Deltaproteobacteria bacterium]
MTESTHIVCSKCGSVNGIPPSKDRTAARCGKCKQPLLNRGPVNVTGEQFQKIVARSHLPVVVDFWASWCGPCQMMAPQFESAASAHHGDVVYLKLNTEQHQQAAAMYNIRSIPTMVLFKNGREAARTSGAMSAAQIQQWVTANR